MTIRERLSSAIRTSMRERDKEALSIYRTTLGAIANAEAVPTDVGAGAIESSSVGVGTTDVERLELTEAAVASIVRSEILELTMGSKHVGPEDQRRMLYQADVLEKLLHHA